MDQKEVISPAASPATAISKHVIELLSLVKDASPSAKEKLNYTRGYVASLYKFSLIGEELFNIVSNQLLQSEARIDAMELE
jgi:hypothetical protein